MEVHSGRMSLPGRASGADGSVARGGLSRRRALLEPELQSLCWRCVSKAQSALRLRSLSLSTPLSPLFRLREASVVSWSPEVSKPAVTMQQMCQPSFPLLFSTGSSVGRLSSKSLFKMP